MYRRLEKLEDPNLFRAWMFRIANRAGVRHLKKRKRWMEQTYSESAFLDMLTTEIALVDKDLDVLLDLDEISPASRGVLILHFREEMTLPEIAAVLEVPVGTVKSRLAYGLAALRKQFGQTRSI